MLGSSAVMPHTTNSEALNVIHLGMRIPIYTGASGPAIQLPLSVSAGASQPSMHQTSYIELPIEYPTNQRLMDGYDAITSNKSQVVSSEHLGWPLLTGSESAQERMTHIPDITNANGDSLSEFYGITDDTVDTFLIPM
jgi:hypothetical protein